MHDIERHLPLRPVDYLILRVLMEGETHGYQIVKQIEALTEGSVKLVPSNFYARLRRMERDGLLDERAARPADTLDGKPRSHFAITTDGRLVATAEVRRMSALVQDAESLSLVDGPPDGDGE